MRIHITDAGTITLLEPGNFRALDILIDPQPPEQIHRLVARIGRFEGEDYVRISPAVLRFLSPLAGRAEWEEGFAAMIAHAGKAGWVDETGLVRAHVARADHSPPQVTDDEFRGAMRRLAAGVSAVTAGSTELPFGMIASSVVSISAEPPLVGVFVNQSSSSLPLFRAEKRFAVNILGSGHGEVVRNFGKASQGPARFASGDWQSGRQGLPVLTSALAAIECLIVSEIALGTHWLLVGRVESTRLGSDVPMVHFDGGTRQLRLADA